MKSSKVDMLSGSITKGLLSMAIPLMIMYVVQALFNIVDMTALKFFSDGSAVGAVGTCGSLISVCTSLLVGTSVGANVVVAKRIGSKNREKVENAVMTSLLTSIIGGVILAVIGVVFAETFIKMVNCPDKLLAQATLYFKIYFWGLPIFMLYNFCASILRAMGDTKRPMYYLITAGALKLIFTISLLFIVDIPVVAVAVATIIAYLTIVILAIRTLLNSKDIFTIDFHKIRLDLNELKEILFIGIPSGIQTGLYSFANTIIMSTVNKFGADATTGISIANQFDGIIYYIIYSPALATTSYVSQNIGAKNIDRVKKAIKASVLITILLGGFFGGLSAIFSGPLASIMSSSPAVIEYAKQKMIIISSTYFICGINESMGGVLKGLGKPIIPTVSTFIFMCLLRFVWVYIIFPLCPNLTFLYTVWPIGWILSLTTLSIAYYFRMKKLSSQIALQTV